MAAKVANRAYCGATINGEKIEFLGKKSIYDSLKSVLGLDHVSETHKDGYRVVTRQQLIKEGLAVVVTVRGKDTSNRPKSGSLTIPSDKVATALNKSTGLEKSSKYGTWDIDSAYQSGDRRITY